MSSKLVPGGPTAYNPVLVQLIICHQTGDQSIPEAMLAKCYAAIYCVARQHRGMAAYTVFSNNINLSTVILFRRSYKWTISIATLSNAAT